MNIDKILEIAKHEFQQKLTEFCQNRDFTKLTAENAEEFARGLRAGLSAAGAVAYQTFIESHDESAETILREGVVFRFKQGSRKHFLTPFGEIAMTRRLYQADQGGKSYVPLDEKWGMQGQYATSEVRESILYSVALMTPEESACLLLKSALFHPSPTAIKHIVADTGAVIEERKEALDQKIRQDEPVPPGTEAVAISFDGVNVLLAERGQRKGRKVERPKAHLPARGLRQAGKSDSVKTAYRHAMVGSISYYGKEEGQPKRLESRYTARMPESKFLTFRQQFEQEIAACFEKVPEEATKLVITDGHPGLEKYIERNPLLADCEILIDFYHAMEHLSLAAEAIFGKSAPAANRWFEKWRQLLLHQEHSIRGFYRSMKYYRTAIGGARREALCKEMNYFKKRKAKMNYAYYRNQGLPIASGPVEAACKSIVKARLCRSGMRWSRTGGQNILNLRTYVKSGRWQSFWNHHQADCYHDKIAA